MTRPVRCFMLIFLSQGKPSAQRSSNIFNSSQTEPGPGGRTAGPLPGPGDPCQDPEQPGLDRPHRGGREGVRHGLLRLPDLQHLHLHHQHQDLLPHQGMSGLSLSRYHLHLQGNCTHYYGLDNNNITVYSTEQLSQHQCGGVTFINRYFRNIL